MNHSRLPSEWCTQTCTAVPGDMPGLNRATGSTAGTCGCEPPAWAPSCPSPEKRSRPPTACLTTGDRFLHELSTCSFTPAATPHLGPQPTPAVTTVQGPSAWSSSSPRAQPQDEGNVSRPSAPHPASPWTLWSSGQECTPGSCTTPAHQLCSASQAAETTQLLFPGSSMAPKVDGTVTGQPCLAHSSAGRRCGGRAGRLGEGVAGVPPAVGDGGQSQRRGGKGPWWAEGAVVG